MSDSLRSLINSGTKLWLDSIDPDLVRENREFGATGATSNPIIIANLIKTGRFDDQIRELIESGQDDDSIAWELTDRLVKDAQNVFLATWEQTAGNDGYVSFEVDPLIDDFANEMPHQKRVALYTELAKKWSAGHPNRMIKVPATDAGLGALEEITAAGVPLNVTLIFTMEQYHAARDAVWRGAQRLSSREKFKSVYSIFVSRIDVYTQKACANLSNAAQGQVGIVNAKRIWAENQDYWVGKKCPLDQEIIFASTGTKRPEDPPWKYVQALAGSDIQTNPPATNEKVVESGLTFERQVDVLPDEKILDEIDEKVEFQDLYATLMREGVFKFAEPQKELLALIGERRKTLSAKA